MTIERNYFIAVHHQAGAYFENFTEVKFRDKLRPSAARQVISLMVLNLSRFKPKKLW